MLRLLENELPHCVWIKGDTTQHVKSLCTKTLLLSGDVASLPPGQFKRRCLSPELISPWPIACKVLWVQFIMVVTIPQYCRWAFGSVQCWSKSPMDWLNHPNWNSLCVLDLSGDLNHCQNDNLRVLTSISSCVGLCLVRGCVHSRGGV